MTESHPGPGHTRPGLFPLVGVRCVVALAVLLAGAIPLAGQTSPTQWSSMLMVSAMPSPFLADWERNPQLATLSVTYTGTEPAEYSLSAEVRGLQRGLISKSTSGPYGVPFGPTTQLIASTQLACFSAENLETFVDQVIRTGMIPEDRYELVVRVLSLDGKELARSAQQFVISLPEPPRLIFPSNGSTVMGAQPMFQWTPVMVPPELGIMYRVRVVEVLQGQTPDVALTANLPHFAEVTDMGANLLYPLDALTLEEGHRYAWEVEALNGGGDAITSSRRRSEQWTFTRASMVAVDDPTRPALTDSLDLIPGAATLTGLLRATRRDDGDRIELTGRATLRLSGAYEASTNVQLDGISFDGAALPNAVVIGGALGGRFGGAGVPVAPLVSLTEVRYTGMRGLRMQGAFTLPGQPPIPLEGDVEISGGGAYGILRARLENDERAPTVSSGGVDIRLTSVRVSLPDGATELRGSVALFGEEACADIPMSVGPDGTLHADVACAARGTPMPLALGSDRVVLSLSRLTGAVDIDPAGGALTPALQATAELLLDGTSGAHCGGSVVLTFDENGAEATGFEPRCDPDEGYVDLGWLHVRLANPTMDRLQYTPATGFTFAFGVDGLPSAPAFPLLGLPSLDGIGYSNVGVTLPGSDGLAGDDPLDIGGFLLRPGRIRSDGLNVPWQTWGGDTALRYTTAGTLSLGALPVTAPLCLGAPFPATVTLSGDRITAELTGQALGADCLTNLGRAGDLSLSRIGGRVSATIAALPAVDEVPRVQGALALPAMFACAAPAPLLSLGANGFEIGADGTVRGQASGVDVPCPLALAAVDVSLRSATLTITPTDSVPEVWLEGGAAASFAATSGAVNGQGSLTLDLQHARLAAGSVRFAGPFLVGLPRNAPALTFEVPEAVLDVTGLHVDGRGNLLFIDRVAQAATTIGTTFAGLTINPVDFAVTDGRANFDEAFGLAGMIAGDGTLSWQAVRAGVAAPGSGDAFRIDVPASATLEAGGLHLGGTGDATLRYGAVELTTLTAAYSDALSILIDPFGVRSGAVDLNYGTRRLAWVDESGFHADELGLIGAGYPQQLGLPSVDVAYLDLAPVGGQAAVDMERVGDIVRIRTRPNSTVPLVIPALARGLRVDTVQATVDLALDVLGAIRGGTVTAVVAPARIDLRANGIPFLVSAFLYDAGATTSLRLSGQPYLFDEPRGAPGGALLDLQVDGRVAGRFTTDAGGQTVTIANGARGFALVLDSVSGDIDVDPRTGSGPRELRAAGSLTLALGDGQRLGLPAKVRVTPLGIEVEEVGEDPLASIAGSVTLGALEATFSNMRVPRLAYGPLGWDFEVLLDAALGFADMPGVAVDARDLSLVPGGLDVPAVEAPELTGPAMTVGAYTMRPLALRADAGRLDWFGVSVPSAWNVRFDVEVTQPSAPGRLSEARMTILDARPVNGAVRGAIETLTLQTPVDVPLGTRGAAIRVTGIAGTIGGPGDGGGLRLRGALVPPGSMRCAQQAAIPLPDDALELASNGDIRGFVEHVDARCPMTWRSLGIIVADGALSVERTGQAGAATLAGPATVRLANRMRPDTAVAVGAFTLDLVGARLVAGSATVAQPFYWPYGPENPSLGFMARDGVVDVNGLTITGSGTLDVRGGDGGPVDFASLRYDIPGGTLTSGHATVRSAVGLWATFGDNGHAFWQVRRPGEWDGNAGELSIALTSGAVIDAAGIVGAPGKSRVHYRNRDQDALDVTFDPDFHFALSPAGIIAGRADLLLAGQVLATVDRNGFTPGALFDTPVLPTRIGLPSEDVAYVIILDDAGRPLVDVLDINGETHLLSRPNQTVQMVVPSLQGGGSTSFPVLLDVQVDRSFRVVSGSIDAPITNLSFANRAFVPTTMHYADAGNGYTLTVDGTVALPASMVPMTLTLRGVEVTATGLNGTASLGTPATSYAPDLPALTGATVGAARVEITGLAATFTNDAPDLRISGQARAALFQTVRNSTTSEVPVFFTGVRTTGAWSFDAPAAGQVGSRFPMLASTLEPTALGGAAPIRVTATETDFAVAVSGILRIPGVSPDFAVTFAALGFGTRGILVSPASGDQSFTLFGTAFRTVSGVNDNLATYQGGVLTVALGGELTFMGGKAPFTKLTVATDGTVQDHLNLISRPVQVLTDVVSVPSLAIKGGLLNATVAVKLPAPLGLEDEGFSPAVLVVGVDGALQRNTAVLRNENPGLTPGSHKRSVTGLTIHPRLVRLNVDRVDGTSGRIEVVADGYLRGEEANRIFFGRDRGGKVEPGLQLGFDGKAVWGNFQIEDTIYTTVAQKLELDIQAVSGPRGDAFELGLLGRLSLMMSLPGGPPKEPRKKDGFGLLFRDIYLTASGPDLTDMTVDGGSLALFQGALVINVGRFGYSSSPTTIDIEDSSPPPGGGPQRAATRRIAVNNYLQMSGEFCWSKPGSSAGRDKPSTCILGGGVDQILMFEEAADGRTTFIMRNAKVMVQGIINASLDFTMREVDGGLGASFAGRGRIEKFNQEIIIAGILEIGATDLRVGGFMSSPFVWQAGVVTLREVGGGFFWNPRQEHLDMIRRIAVTGMTGGESSLRLTTEPARYAIFLYARGTIADRMFAEGRVLLTVTDKQFRMDGGVALMQKPNEMNGRIALVVGLSRGYVEGTIDLTAYEPMIARWKAQLAFFAYGPDAWGISGIGDMEIFPPSGGSVSVGLTAQAELFIGPRGFLASIHIEQSYSLKKVISLSGGIKAMVWYYEPSSAWGAYAAIDVSVSVLLGAASASGVIEGALVFEGLDPTLYCAGELSVSVMWVGSWSGSIYVTLSPSGIDGGFGRDGGLDAALSTARAVRDQMDASKQEVQAAVKTAMIASATIKLNDADLVRLYAGLQTLAGGGGGFWNPLEAQVWTEQTFLSQSEDRRAYADYYMSVLRGGGMPPADTAAVRTMRARADQQWADVRRQQSGVETRLNAINATVAQAVSANLPRIPSGSPVTGASFAAPVTTTSFNGTDTVKTMTSGPRFDLDPQAAAARVSAATQSNAARAALAAEVFNQAKAVDATLGTVQAATSGGDGSLMSVLSAYGVARGTTERLYAEQLRYLGTALTWTRAARVGMQNRRNLAINLQDAEALKYRSTFAFTLSGPLNRNLLYTNLFETIVTNRVRLVANVLNDPGMAQAYQTTASKLLGGWGVRTWDAIDFMATQFRNTGLILYSDAPLKGLTNAETTLQASLTASRDSMRMKLDPIETNHLKLSAAVDRMYAGQTALAGLAQDLYDRYLVMSPTGGSAAAATTRRTALTQGLVAPKMQPVSVSVATTGTVAEVTYQWSAYHPAGTTEYLFRDGPSGDALDQYYSNGSQNRLTLVRSMYESGNAPPTSETRRFSGLVRGGLGIRTLQAAEYTITYAPAATVNGQPGTPATTTTSTTAASANDRTPPLTPVVTVDGAGVHSGQSWIQPASRVVARWSSRDLESGIAEYRVAIGTTPKGTEVMGWTPMGGRVERVLDNLDLRGRSTIYVHVIARNGAGLESAEGVSAALRIDNTPPSFTDVSYGPPVGVSAPATMGPAGAACGVGSAPPGLPAGFSGIIGSTTAVPPKRDFLLPRASDAQSGVGVVVWRFGTDTVAAYDAKQSGWAPASASGTASVAGPQYKYNTPYVLSVAVVNGAGIAVVKNYRNVLLGDPAPPSPAAFCASFTSGGQMTFRFGSVASDPESGVVGYQLRVGTPGDANLLPFNNDTKVRDLGVVPANGSITLNNRSWAEGIYYTELRAINGMGGASSPVRSGPVMFDRSPPPAPSVSFTTTQAQAINLGWLGYIRVAGAISVAISARPDQLSGLKTVEMAVGTAPGATNVVSWVTVVRSDLVLGDAAPRTAGYRFQTSTTGGEVYHVTVRTTNHAGLSTTQTAMIQAPPARSN